MEHIKAYEQGFHHKLHSGRRPKMPWCLWCEKEVDSIEEYYSLDKQTYLYAVRCHGKVEKTELSVSQIVDCKVEAGVAFQPKPKEIE